MLPVRILANVIYNVFSSHKRSRHCYFKMRYEW